MFRCHLSIVAEYLLLNIFHHEQQQTNDFPLNNKDGDCILNIDKSNDDDAVIANIVERGDKCMSMSFQ